MSARAGRAGIAGVWICGVAGAAGSALVALAATRLVDPAVRTWWFQPSLSRGVAQLALYAGLVIICGAWLALGSLLDRTSTRILWLIGAAWAVPVLLGPPVFSRDVYSYLAQGELLHLGLDPYTVAPHALAAHGQGHVLSAVDSFWRRTTAPYGPLFLWLLGPIASLGGSHLVTAALLVKVLDALGAVGLAVCVPRLANALGADPVRALWLVALSPLMLLQLIAAGHNDALMGALMVAGLLLAEHRRPLLAIAVCAVAATIKLPAAAAIVFIVVAHMRAAPGGVARRRTLIGAVAICAAVLAIVAVLTGVGLRWISAGVFSTPQKVRLALTPATAVGYTVASLLHDVGLAANARSIEGTLGDVVAVGVVVLGAVLLLRVRLPDLVRYLGILLIAAALGGPASWPWYLTWGLALLACCESAQRRIAFPIVLTVPVFLVEPGGIALPPRDWSPLLAILYVLVALGAWRGWRRRGRELTAFTPRPEPST